MALTEETFKKMYPFASNYLEVDGHRYHYLDEGEGPVLLMLHGNPTWSFYYRNLVKELKGSYRCIVPDHIGCGLSDKPQDYEYRLANHVSNVQKLIEHLKLDSYTLVVHDWGGPIGLGVAAGAPDRVERLVVFNTSCELQADYPWQIKACRLPVLGPFSVRAFNAFARAAAALCCTRKKIDPDVRAGLLMPYDSWANRIATIRFVQDIPFEANHPTRATGQAIEAEFPKIKDKPAIVFWGMKDFCFTERFLDAWEKLLTNAEVHRFDDAGHYVVEDAHEDIMPLLKAFLAR